MKLLHAYMGKCILIAMGFVLLSGQVFAQQIIKTKGNLIYPQSRKTDAVDTFWGIPVKDPYRWLEDVNSSAATEWVAEQNKITDKYLSKISFLPNIKNRLTQLWDYPKVSGGFSKNGYVFFYKNEGLLDQSILYRQVPGKEAEVFFDPNKLSSDGTTSLSAINFTKDGTMVACQISEKGSDLHKLIVLKTADKTVVGDTLYNIRFSGIVWRGNEGFYYSSYPNPENDYFVPAKNGKLYFHKIGSAQKKDSIVFSDPGAPGNMIGITSTNDDRYLIISNTNNLHGDNKLFLLDVSVEGNSLVPIVNEFNSENSFLFNEGNKLYILTSLNAPNKKVVTVDASNPSVNNWKDLIAEKKNILLGVSRGGGKLFAGYLKDAASEFIQYDVNGKYEHTIDLPGLGTAAGFAGGESDTTLYYTFTNYTLPTTTFQYNIRSGKSVVFKKADEIRNFDPSGYESQRIFCTSKGGVRVPMFVTYKKGVKLNGKNPTVLYGYGGFGVSLTPAFSIPNVALLERGFICVVVNLRGGSEYGRNWHKAGMQMNKQNVFDDFIAAAEFLISNKYTSRRYLALHGISNGGLLAGAVVTQRPDLFKAALIDVGVLDVVRFNKYGLGVMTGEEYGIPDESKQMFDYLLKYSPYHALKPGKKYPATLILAADHDNSVTPFWSYKFAARLQEYQPSGEPILLRTEANVGHGYGKPMSVTITEQAEQFAFLFYSMELKWK